MKKLKSLCIAGLAGVLMLCGCGSSTQEPSTSPVSDEQNAVQEEELSVGAAVTGDKSSHAEDGKDPIELAFVLYDWSDDQGTYLESYLNYLADNMNISVECVSYSDSTEDLIDTVESLCSKGVDGIAVASDAGFQSWAKICEDNGVYCSIMLGRLSDEDDREYAAGLNYYLGSLGIYDYSFLGEIYADYIMKNGYENVLIAGPSQGLQDQADQMVAGTVAVLDENKVKYELVQTAWADLFSSVAAAVASDSYDCIYCPLSVMSFGLPQVYSNNLVGKTVVMGHGTDESMSDVFGTIVAMFSDNLTTSVGVNVALMVNAVEGNTYPDWPSGTAVNIQSPILVIQTEEDFEVYSQYIRNFENPVYYLNVAAVQDMIMSYNGDATYAGIVDYIENLSLDNVAEQAK